MKAIGGINPERLKNIPKAHWADHELCFHLHDLMVSLLIKTEGKKSADFNFQVETQEDIDLLRSGINVFDFLEKTGRHDLGRRSVIEHICHALYADMLHFIYEALCALEKRKFTVAYALLRKPFKEGILVLAQICANETDFYDKLKKDAKNITNMRQFDDVKLKSILRGALESCRGSNFTNEEVIHDYVFNRRNEFGLAGLFDKATHIATDNKSIMTSNFNLNFIFKNPEDNDIYSGAAYQQIAMILLFMHIMQIELHGRSGESDKKYENWMLFTSIGAYQALFKKGKSPMTGLINKDFAEMMQCIVCGSDMRLRKSEAPRFFIQEVIECNKCGSLQGFPLRWLLSKIDIEIFD